MKEKFAVLREDLLYLTKNYKTAIILEKLMYWTEQAKQENSEFDGWLHRSSEVISADTLLKLSSSSIRSHLNKLEELNLIEHRPSNIKFDRTYEYRVKLDYINDRLAEWEG